MEVIPYVLLGIIALFFGFQFAFRLGTHRLQGKPAPELSDVLGKELDPTHKALFYFYSAYCPPCRTMAPRVDRLTERYPNVFKINISESGEIAHRFGITATPSVILVDGGMITRAMVGTQSEKRLAALLEPDPHQAPNPG